MNILFDLLIFSLPFGVISRINLYPNVYVYLHDIFATLIFVVFAFNLLAKKVKVENNALFKYFCAFIGICFVSLVVNLHFLNTSSFFVSFLYIIRYIVYGSLLFAIPRSNKYLKTLNPKLVIAGLIFVLFGYIQYFFYPNLRNLFYAGWDEHLYRLFSTMLDPNFAGMFLTLVTILLLGNFINSLEQKKTQNTLVLGLLSLFSLGAIYFTYSRSAFIALIAGVIALLYVKKMKKIIYPVVILLVIALFIFSNSKIEGTNLFRKVSSSARIRSASTAIYVIQRNPVLGVGFNAYRYAQFRYGLRTRETLKMSNADAGSDNSYLFVLATTGIVGFLFFARFLIEILRLLKNNIESKDVISTVAFPSFVALVIDTIFLNSLFYPLIITWVFLLVGVTVSRKQ